MFPENTQARTEKPKDTKSDAHDARLGQDAARCGGNGLAGYDDRALRERWIRCPSYGQSN